MNLTVGNECVTLEYAQRDEDLYKIRLARSTIRGKKSSGDVVELHFNSKKAKLTSWPKRWSNDLRHQLQALLSSYLKENPGGFDGSQPVDPHDYIEATG